MQRISLAIFFSSLPTFLVSVGHFLSSHSTWASVTSPPSIGELLLIMASFVTTIVGALGIQLPRSNNQYGDRSTDPEKEKENENE